MSAAALPERRVGLGVGGGGHRQPGEVALHVGDEGRDAGVGQALR